MTKLTVLLSGLLALSACGATGAATATVGVAATAVGATTGAAKTGIRTSRAVLRTGRAITKRDADCRRKERREAACGQSH